MRGGLARAVRAQQREDAARGHAERRARARPRCGPNRRVSWWVSMMFMGKPAFAAEFLPVRGHGRPARRPAPARASWPRPPARSTSAPSSSARSLRPPGARSATRLPTAGRRHQHAFRHQRGHDLVRRVGVDLQLLAEHPHGGNLSPGRSWPATTAFRTAKIICSATGRPGLSSTEKGSTLCYSH